MSWKERKKKLADLYAQMKKLEVEMREIFLPFIEEEWKATFDYKCIPFWDCDQSPVGWCVYNHDTDPAHDNCIYCGLPLERS